MKEKYIKIKNLSISENLANFINKELLPGTKINKEKFWKGFDKCVHELAPKNIKLLQRREKLQKGEKASIKFKRNHTKKQQKGRRIRIVFLIIVLSLLAYKLIIN